MSSIARAQSSFLFLAANATGGRTLGVRRARDRRALAVDLRKERLVPIRSWQLPAWAAVGEEGRLKLKDHAELNTQLAQLLSRGVPLVEALDVVATSIGPSNRSLIGTMRDKVASGTSFADACQQTGAFDRVTVAVYRAAERTGDLAGAARQLSSTARRQLRVQGKAATLALYPLVVLSISSLLIIFMLTFVVPRIGKALSGSGQPLPWFTQALVGAGTFLRDHWLWFLLGGLVAIALVVFARKAIGVLLSRLGRRVPIFRELLLAQESARFFTVMAAMTKSGITLADALGVAVGAIGDPRMRKQLTTLQTRLIEGGVLRVLIDGVDTLPIPTRRLLIAAERSGDLTNAFETLAGDHADEVERRSERAMAVLEPALIVGMFLFIAPLLLAIMLPMMKMAGQSL